MFTALLSLLSLDCDLDYRLARSYVERHPLRGLKNVPKSAFRLTDHVHSIEFQQVDGVPMVHVVIEVVLMLLLLKVVFFTKKKSAKHLSAQVSCESQHHLLTLVFCPAAAGHETPHCNCVKSRTVMCWRGKQTHGSKL